MFIIQHHCVLCNNSLFDDNVNQIDTFTKECCNIQQIVSPFTSDVFTCRINERDRFRKLRSHLQEHKPLLFNNRLCKDTSEFIKCHLQARTSWKYEIENEQSDSDDEITDEEFSFGGIDIPELEPQSIIARRKEIEENYSEAFPSNMHNTISNNLYCFEHIRRRWHTFDSIPYANITIDPRFICNNEDIRRIIVPVHKLSNDLNYLRDAHYYTMNDVSKNQIKLMHTYYNRHSTSNPHILNAENWSKKRSDIYKNIYPKIWNFVEGSPFVRIENYLCFWYCNPILAKNTIHKKPEKNHAFMHRSDEFDYYSINFEDDTLVDLIYVFGDGTSKTFKSRSASVTGIYSGLMNTTPQYLNSIDNVWLNALCENEIDELIVMKEFVKNAIELYDPFSLYNAYYSSLNGEETFTKHSVRLVTSLFDGKDRFKFSSIWGGGSYRGNCASCEVSSSDMYMTIDELSELQEEINRYYEKQIEEYQDDYVSNDYSISKNKENVYNLRSIKRREEVIDISKSFADNAQDQEIISKLIGGYKLEENPFISNGIDVYEINICERYHMLFHTCGLVKLDLDLVLKSVEKSGKTQELNERLSIVTSSRYSLSNLDHYDFQQIEKVTPYIVVCIDGLVSSSLVKRFQLCVALAQLLSTPYYFKPMKSILNELFNAHHRAGVALSKEEFVRQKSHETNHAIYEKKDTGILIDCQIREKYHLQVKKQYTIYKDTYTVMKRLLLKHYLTYLRLISDTDYLKLLSEKEDDLILIKDDENECFFRVKLMKKESIIVGISIRGRDQYRVGRDFIFYGTGLISIGMVEGIEYNNNQNLSIKVRKYQVDYSTRFMQYPKLCTTNCRRSIPFLESSIARVIQSDDAVFLQTFTSHKNGDLIGETNYDLCASCYIGGELLLCDGCPYSYHLECSPMDSFHTEKDWFCGNCVASDQNIAKRRRLNEHV